MFSRCFVLVILKTKGAKRVVLPRWSSYAAFHADGTTFRTAEGTFFEKLFVMLGYTYIIRFHIENFIPV
jgi:hypothetical protein